MELPVPFVKLRVIWCTGIVRSVKATATGKKQSLFNPVDAPAVDVRCSAWVAPSARAANCMFTEADCVVTRTYLMVLSVPAGTLLTKVLSYHVAFVAKLVE